MFENDIERPKDETHCLCGHRIKQQCYLCLEGSTNIEYIIALGTVVSPNGVLRQPFVVKVLK